MGHPVYTFILKHINKQNKQGKLLMEEEELGFPTQQL